MMKFLNLENKSWKKQMRQDFEWKQYNLEVTKCEIEGVILKGEL